MYWLEPLTCLPKSSSLVSISDEISMLHCTFYTHGNDAAFLPSKKLVTQIKALNRALSNTFYICTAVYFGNRKYFT